MLSSAGGGRQVAGDYLYRTFIQGEFDFGMWGVMRVGEPGSDIVTIARATNDARGWGYAISGANTVNPNNGKMAAEVTITANVIAPNTKDPKPVSCTVPVQRDSGQWDTATCPLAPQGVLVVNAGRPITVVSTEHGRTLINGFVPSAPAKPPSLEEIATRVQEVNQENLQLENKELIQFKGERTPTATVLPLTPLRPSQSTPSFRPVRRTPPLAAPGMTRDWSSR